mgnify:CR=1 FL=1
MEYAAPRQRGNREYDDEESPSTDTLRLLRVAMLLLVGTRLVLLTVVCTHGHLRPRLCGEGRGHTHPQSLGHEARSTPASSHRRSSRSLIPTGHEARTTEQPYWAPPFHPGRTAKD